MKRPGKDIPPDNKNLMEEDEAVYNTAKSREDEARLREAIHRSDDEKFFLFTRMLRINMMLKNAKVTHKNIE
ncbi:MAG TPA: hypothetical protein VLD19_17615 [Chitinophagaceae bacterium]|nr:hypothetical protein [Chitinophagaceae bacterium]